MGIKNSGRVIARLPSLRYAVVPGINFAAYCLDGNGHWGFRCVLPPKAGSCLGGAHTASSIQRRTAKSSKLAQPSPVAQWLPVGAPERWPNIFRRLKCGLAADSVSYQDASHRVARSGPALQIRARPPLSA